MKPFPPLLACAAALLLSSCWHLGERQRNAADTYTGVDIFHPVDGKIHHAPGKDKHGQTYGYVIAPEIRYKILGPTAHWFLDKPAPSWAEYARPTGRVLVARIGRGGFREIVPELPRGLRTSEAPKEADYRVHGEESPHIVAYWRGDETPLASEVGRLSSETGKLSTGQRLLAGTCDYVVDPLLDVTTVPVACATLLAAGTLGTLTYYTILNPVQQQQQASIPPPPEP